jgi:hypothetical protein
MEGARSRTVNDKYWQITAKDGETPPQPWSVVQEANNYNYLIFRVTKSFIWPDHLLGTEPALRLRNRSRILAPIRKKQGCAGEGQ